RTVGWLVSAFEKLNNPETVLNAWKSCRTGNFNLSWESLTSKETRDILRSLHTNDPEFFK
ncbi:hypothetical protein BDQ17DRAFT_1196985, partial [Cyathus striatus]